MSDPVTNVEIEDVLLSIRRLVSVDDRPEKEVVDDESAADKLVLTPALRVDSESASKSEDNASDDAEVEAQSDEDHVADLSEEAADDDVWQDESVAEEDQPQLEAAQDQSDEGQDDDKDEVAEADLSEPADQEEADVAAEMAAPVTDLTAHAAEIEEAVAAREDDWEPDGEPGAANSAEPMTSLPWQDHTSVETDTTEGPFEASETEGLDPFVPEDDPADEAEYFAEDAAPDASEPEAAPGNAFLAEDDLLEESAEAILDEETLRDLVAEIVRQELQGSLGERITRNVRKLVRREIQRALAAQELE